MYTLPSQRWLLPVKSNLLSTVYCPKIPKIIVIRSWYCFLFLRLFINIPPQPSKGGEIRTQSKQCAPDDEDSEHTNNDAL